MVTHTARSHARPVIARVYPVVRGHGISRVWHGQLHAMLLPDVPTWPAVLPGRRAAGGRRMPSVGIPGFPVTTVAVAAQPELRDWIHTGGPI